MSDSRYPKVTVALIAACFLVFLLEIIFPPVESLLWLTPSLVFKYGLYWQFITYMFAHANISHIGFNMIGLFIFGGVMERVLGWKKYLTLYIVSGIGSALLHIALAGMFGDLTRPLLGASGAVFAVLTAYAFKYPKNILFVFPGIPVPAALLVAFFVVFELFSGMFGFQEGIANFGHLGGILTGAIMMLYWMRSEDKDPESQDFDFVWESW